MLRFFVIICCYVEMFFASKNSPVLQKLFPRHRWGIFMLTWLVYQGVPHTIALSVKYEQIAVMHQPVNHGGSHLFIIEDAYPPAEFQVGGDYYASFFVAVGYYLKQKLCSLTLQGYIPPFIADKQVQLAKLF